MSIKERLSVSGIIEKTRVQRSNQTMTFTVQQGASIYVQKNDLDFEILHRALRNGKFPNSDRLLDYVKANCLKTIRHPDDPAHAYRLRGDAHIDAVVETIRQGM